VYTQGAHVYGHNHHSVGICLIGGVNSDGESENNYTPEQLLMLRILIDGLKAMFPKSKLIGHCDFPGVAKDCPCFDVREWYGR
jgi:N-acetylmuramoyl-L-alanine amidase